MTRLLGSWLALPGADRRLAAGLALAMPIVAMMVSTLGVVRSKAVLDRLSRPEVFRAPDDRDFREAHRLSKISEAVGRRSLLRSTCLRQSLLVYMLLRRRGLDPSLEIGVLKNGVELDAHAWVSLAGVALGQTVRHVPFGSLESGFARIRGR
jgi:hypothetical protein